MSKWYWCMDLSICHDLATLIQQLAAGTKLMWIDKYVHVHVTPRFVGESSLNKALCVPQFRTLKQLYIVQLRTWSHNIIQSHNSVMPDW